MHRLATSPIFSTSLISRQIFFLISEPFCRSCLQKNWQGAGRLPNFGSSAQLSSTNEEERADPSR